MNVCRIRLDCDTRFCFIYTSFPQIASMLSFVSNLWNGVSKMHVSKYTPRDQA